jgi:dynein intermediate chain 2
MPEMELQPPSPLCCLRFNPKSTDILVGGCYNGLVTYFDMRKPGAWASRCVSVLGQSDVSEVRRRTRPRALAIQSACP